MSEATAGVPEANASVRTMPKLSPPSDGATSRSASPSSRHFSSSVTRPAISTPSVSSSSGSTSVSRGARDGQPGVDAGAAQRLEGAQQDRQALALLGAAEEEQLERAVGGALGRARGGEVDAVRDDPVLPP